MIKEVDFTNIKEVKANNIIPVYMQLGNECFEIAYNKKQIDNAWSIFQKLFFNKIYLNNPEYIDSLINALLFKTDNRDGKIIFSNSDKTFHNEKAHDLDTATKFSPNYYVLNYRTNRFNNLVVVRKIINDLNIKDFRLFITTDEDIKEADFKNDYIKTKKLFTRKRKNPYIIKKGNLVIGHINGQILSDEEKLIRDIRKKFSKTVLLGDIVLDEKQEEILNNYMREQLAGFVKSPSSFSPAYSRVFAVGLVRYAMKYYNKKHNGDFWPYFQQEYGVKLNPNAQQKMHDLFSSIMSSYNKYYDLTASNKIDNITMHSFVADNCAEQLFEYLLAFWRIDLARGSEDFTDTDDKYKYLISAMANSSGEQKVMSHTSLLINDKKTRVELIRKIKRIIKLINDKFWDDIEVADTGNRINKLLNEWFNNPKGEFQKYKNYVRKHDKHEKGEVYYHSPVLSMSSDYKKLRLVLPQQRLINYSDIDEPIWKINCSDSNVIIDDVKPVYKKDTISYYVERTFVEIPIGSMLNSFTFVLCSGDKEKKYEIKSSNIRFFDDKGKNIDYKTANLPVGPVTAYSNNDNYPDLLDENVQIMHSDGLTMKVMNLIKGQIVVLDDGTGLQAGQKLKEGLNEAYPLFGVNVSNNEKDYEVYSNLPKLLFKATPEEIGGISLMINGKHNKVTEKSIKEFKLEEDLNANGYLIDLKDYINRDGLYTVVLSYPKMNKQIAIGNIAYMYGFGYEFENAPYIFTDNAKIVFKSAARIVKDKNDTNGIWNIDMKSTSFEFNFDENNKNSNNICSYVSEGKLNLECNLDNTKYNISFEIPALYWKFNQSDDWSIVQPANVQLKKLKNDYKKLYVKGPFDFTKSVITTNNDIELAEEESAIKYNGGKSQFFEISKIYDWFKNNRDEHLRQVFISLDGKEVKLFDVICKSKLNSVTLIGDFDNGIMKGEVDIDGDENYTISIYHNSEKICEDLQIVDNKFEVESELETGNYEIFIYEIIESDDDDGFDVETESIPLNNKPIIKQLVNLTNLNNKVIKINGYQDLDKRTMPQRFRTNYYLKEFESVTYDELMDEDTEIIGIWNTDNEEDLIYYRAKLIVENYSNVFKLTDVLVAFSNATTPETIKIFTKDTEGQYDSIKIYDKYRLLSEKQYDDMNKDRKKQIRCECFYDNMYYFLIDIEEE